MSAAILIERTGGITLDEWRRLIDVDEQLRLRVEPYVAVNPRSSETIKISAGEADSEIREAGEWVPFLRWQRGKLTTEYRFEFDDSHNPARSKLVEVSKVLNARLRTDLSDEALTW